MQKSTENKIITVIGETHNRDKEFAEMVLEKARRGELVLIVESRDFDSNEINTTTVWGSEDPLILFYCNFILNLFSLAKFKGLMAERRSDEKQDKIDQALDEMFVNGLYGNRGGMLEMGVNLIYFYGSDNPEIKKVLEHLDARFANSDHYKKMRQLIKNADIFKKSIADSYSEWCACIFGIIEELFFSIRKQQSPYIDHKALTHGFLANIREICRTGNEKNIFMDLALIVNLRNEVYILNFNRIHRTYHGEKPIYFIVGDKHVKTLAQTKAKCLFVLRKFSRPTKPPELLDEFIAFESELNNCNHDAGIEEIRQQLQSFKRLELHKQMQIALKRVFQLVDNSNNTKLFALMVNLIKRLKGLDVGDFLFKEANKILNELKVLSKEIPNVELQDLVAQLNTIFDNMGQDPNDISKAAGMVERTIAIAKQVNATALVTAALKFKSMLDLADGYDDEPEVEELDPNVKRAMAMIEAISKYSDRVVLIAKETVQQARRLSGLPEVEDSIDDDSIEKEINRTNRSSTNGITSSAATQLLPLLKSERASAQSVNETPEPAAPVGSFARSPVANNLNQNSRTQSTSNGLATPPAPISKTPSDGLSKNS